MEKIYNKLIRDEILDIIIKDNETPIYRILEDDEYWDSLINKDKEELNEVKNAKTKEEKLKELSDKLEVIKAMAEYLGYTLEDIIKEADDKRNKKGGFEKRIYLEKTIKE